MSKVSDGFLRMQKLILPLLLDPNVPYYKSSATLAAIKTKNESLENRSVPYAPIMIMIAFLIHINQ